MFHPEEEPPVTPPPTVKVRPAEEYDDETVIEATQRPITQAIPVVNPPDESEWQLQRPPLGERGIRYSVDTETGIVTVRRWLSRRVPSDLPRPFDQLFTRTEYKPYPHTMTIKEDGDVDLTLIPQLDFIPQGDEDELRYFRRHHWWMVGSRLWPWATLWCLVTGCYVGYGVDGYAGAGGTALLYIAFGVLVIYALVRWLQWRWTYLIVTSKRIREIRNYPIINRPERSVRLSALGNQSTKPALLFWNYARFRAGTPETGEDVAWLEADGIRYVANYKVFEQCLNPS